MIRISQIHEGSNQRLLVEGTLSSEWVEVLEDCWFEAQTVPNGRPMRVDLSGVTYVDDKGRELLERMIQDGAELWATGVMTGAVIEEITEKITGQGTEGDLVSRQASNRMARLQQNSSQQTKGEQS